MCPLPPPSLHLRSSVSPLRETRRRLARHLPVRSTLVRRAGSSSTSRHRPRRGREGGRQPCRRRQHLEGRTPTRAPCPYPESPAVPGLHRTQCHRSASASRRHPSPIAEYETSSDNRVGIGNGLASVKSLIQGNVPRADVARLRQLLSSRQAERT